MGIETVFCNTADAFLKTLSLSNSSWWDKNGECSWIFRGQNSTYQLLPSLYRKNDHQSNDQLEYQRIFNSTHRKLIVTVPDMSTAITNWVNNQNNNVGEDKKAPLVELLKACFVEISLIENFLFRCNEIRLNTPSLLLFNQQQTDIGSSEYFYNHLTRDLINEFINNYYTYEIQLRNGFKKLLPSYYPEVMALARHHGIPSRLLDWTNEPLVAAYFSADNSHSNNNLSVWALNKRNLSRDLGYGQIAFYEKLNKIGLEFLHIQKGLFTDMMGIESYFYSHGQWPTLDKYLLTTYINPTDDKPVPQETYFKKIELIPSEKKKLLERLDRMGFNKYSLMPTYDNVGKSVMP